MNVGADGCAASSDLVRNNRFFNGFHIFSNSIISTENFIESTLSFDSDIICTSFFVIISQVKYICKQVISDAAAL